MKKLTNALLSEAESPISRAFEADTKVFPIKLEWEHTSQNYGTEIWLLVSIKSATNRKMYNVSKVLQPRITSALRKSGLIKGKPSRSIGGDVLYNVDPEQANDFLKSIAPQAKFTASRSQITPVESQSALVEFNSVEDLEQFYRSL